MKHFYCLKDQVHIMSISVLQITPDKSDILYSINMF